MNYTNTGGMALSLSQFDLDLELLNSFVEDKCGGKEYYFGCWSADDFVFEHTMIPPNIQLEMGKNWLVLRNGADVTNGLIFPKDAKDDPEVVVFRGYLADDALHSYSDPNIVKDYWSGDLLKQHNGVFSAVTISDGGQKLNVITDLFGMGPVYTRKIGNFIFFSSAASLLSFEDDEPDMTAWYMRLIIGSVPGVRSLSTSITLCESASVTSYSANEQTVSKWYDLNQLPRGEYPVNEDTLKRSEKSLSEAIRKCLNLKNGRIILPLSGGYDSRRLFGHLNTSKVEFETISVQMPTKMGADVDGMIASQIAKDHHVKNIALKYPSDQQWNKNNEKRILALDALCDSHTWSPPLFQEIGHQYSCVYDGIAGDTFVGDGWRYKNFDEDILEDNFPKALNQKSFPEVKTVLSELTRMHNAQPDGPNKGLFTYVAWHSRRNTSLWSQQQALPGQLIVCPYFDLNYVITMLNYVLEDGDMYRIQRGVIEKYWHKLNSYASTRSLPDLYESLGRLADERKDQALRKLMKEIQRNKVQGFRLSTALSFLGNLAMFANRFSRSIRNKTYWWACQISEIFFWWQNRPSFIKMKKEK